MGEGRAVGWGRERLVGGGRDLREGVGEWMCGAHHEFLLRILRREPAAVDERPEGRVVQVVDVACVFAQHVSSAASLPIHYFGPGS